MKLSIPVVTLSAKYNQKLPKRFSKGSETSVYWNKYKKVRPKIQHHNIDIFSNQILLQLADCLF